MEVKSGENIGSYHVIDCQKVSLRYSGQQQTCGRCHQTPQKCLGKGIAKKCQEEGGERVEFTDYILDLWKKIGYSPQNPDVSTEFPGGSFTPPKSVRTDEVFNGVTIKQIPRETDKGLVT